MLTFFEWESSGGCEKCDGMEGFHEDDEPLRPHPHCHCRIYALDEFDLEDMVSDELRDLNWDSDVDLLGYVIDRDHSRFEWDPKEVYEHEWLYFKDAYECPFSMALEVEHDPTNVWFSSNPPEHEVSARVTVRCPITGRQAEEEFIEFWLVQPAPLSQSQIEGRLRDRARAIAERLSEDVCAPDSD
jgi:hypothetical protein